MKKQNTLQTIAIFIGIVAFLCSCSLSTATDDSDSVDSQEVAPVSNTNTANNCAYPLVQLQTGSDSECTGGNIHEWPVGMGDEDCHGWSSYDTSGKLHENSANNIRCNADGTFTFTQFAGTLTCEGGREGVVKTYALNSCEQDIPPTLFTKAIDLTCCINPDSPECTTGIPSVSVSSAPSDIYLNGELCVE